MPIFGHSLTRVNRAKKEPTRVFSTNCAFELILKDTGKVVEKTIDLFTSDEDVYNDYDLQIFQVRYS